MGPLEPVGEAKKAEIEARSLATRSRLRIFTEHVSGAAAQWYDPGKALLVEGASSDEHLSHGGHA